jgi:drug/metabolite transporter superfamily protein YnfA
MIIWSIIWGWMFFADLPDSWTLIGTAIIIISGILTSGVMRYLKPNELKTKLKRTIR